MHIKLEHMWNDLDEIETYTCQYIIILMIDPVKPVKPFSTFVDIN